jgi:type II secretory pathway component GspD/PulD (secretin)
VKRLLTLLLLIVVATVPASAYAANTRISIDARATDLCDVIRLLAMQSGENLVPDASIKPTKVTLRLHDVSLAQAVETLAQAYGLQVHREGTIEIIGDATAMNRRYPNNDERAGTKTVVFPLVRARADDVKAALIDALPAGTVVVPDKRTGSVIVTASAWAIVRARTLVAALDVADAGTASASSPHVVALRNIRASDAAKALKGSFADGVLIADDRENAVVVTGNEATQNAARQLLASIDSPGKQVMFEVRVADMQPQQDNDNVGVLIGGTMFGTSALDQFPYAVTKSSFAVNAQLNTLIQRGRASVLAQPRIATLNNHEATLLVGETYPVVEVNVQTGFPTVTNVDVGVKLRLTPTIGADNAITAEFHPEYSQITGFNNSFPIIANRKVDSMLRIRDGETIVLGGLFSDVDSETITKFPVLGDLPGLGAFFRNKQRTHNKDEIIFFITPHVL